MAYLIAAWILVAFTAGYAFIGRRVVSPGAFYAYVAEGLGKPFGVGAAYCAVIAYGTFAFGLAAACGYFDEQVFLAVGCKVNWTICAAVSIFITGMLNRLLWTSPPSCWPSSSVVELAVLLVFDVSVIMSQGLGGISFGGLSREAYGWRQGWASLMTAFTCFVGFESAPCTQRKPQTPCAAFRLQLILPVFLIGSFYLVTAWIAIGAMGASTAKATAIAHGGTLMLDLIKQYDGEIASDVAGVLAGAHRCWQPISPSMRRHRATSMPWPARDCCPRLLSRFDEARKVPATATIFISARHRDLPQQHYRFTKNPYAAIFPCLFSVGTVGIIALQAPPRSRLCSMCFSAGGRRAFRS